MIEAILGGLLVGTAMWFVGYTQGHDHGCKREREAFHAAAIETVQTHRSVPEVRAILEVLWRRAFPGSPMPFPPPGDTKP